MRLDKQATRQQSFFLSTDGEFMTFGDSDSDSKDDEVVPKKKSHHKKTNRSKRDEIKEEWDIALKESPTPSNIDDLSEALLAARTEACKEG